MNAIAITLLDTKPLLTLKEALQYTGIGINKLREMSNEKTVISFFLLEGRECLKEQLCFDFWNSRILSNAVN